MDQRKQNLITSISTFLIVLLLCVANEIKSAPTNPSKQQHFVLVHGSCFGAWSWYKLVTLVRSSGHNVTALDLAASGVDPQQAKNLQSISDYLKPLRDFMEAIDGKVILVGHSLGGLAISQAMERFPGKISVAVFVTALMPGPALNISSLNKESFRRQDSLLDSRYTYDQGPSNPPTTLIFGPLYLKSRVYQLSPIEDVALGSMLMRPLRLFSEEDLSKKLKLTNKNYGSVNRVYVISEGDLVGKKDFQRWMIKKNRPNKVVEITGSDHMVMISKPLELWLHIQRIIKNYT
ncbi:esterase PIR7B-like [Pyrus ussuriensis x Pyrus communis]|uniref:(S)-hydroxynitrile lyase n=1 Tax=Pyrus ussuriensis x Pyrus communis TaxID=2448454 RepID=A0A5N5I9K0_9ROSA|nr:esterase PIR7B-like [Pyrus ussuriensis x Pyrus communis]